MNELKQIILPTTVLAGMIIGVGFFSLPYITLQVGLPFMLIYFLILGTIVTIVHLIFGEVALNTPDFKRMPGFAKFYLGKRGEIISFFFSIFVGLGGLLAYLIVGGSFLESLLSPFLRLNNSFYTLIYFAFASFFIYFGIKAIAKLNFWALGFLFLVLIAIFNNSYQAIEIENLFLGSVETIKDAFLPYGAVLYSLWGATLIPNIEEMLNRKKHLIEETIVTASLIPPIVYFVFIYLVLGLRGVNTSPTALIGLESQIRAEIVNLALILGLLTTFTSFVSSGLVLKNIFMYDLKIGKNISWFIVCFVPLFLFFLGMDNFIQVISLLGGIGFSIDGILILLMYKKLKERKKERVTFWIFPLILVFVLGMAYELIYFFS